MNYYVSDLLTLTSEEFFSEHKTSAQVILLRLLTFKDTGDELSVMDDSIALKILIKVMEHPKGELKHLPLASLLHARLKHESIFEHIKPHVLMNHIVSDIKLSMINFKEKNNINDIVQSHLIHFSVQSASALCSAVSICKREDLNASLTEENLYNHPLSILLDHVKNRGINLDLLQNFLFTAKTLPINIRKLSLRTLAQAYVTALQRVTYDSRLNGFVLSKIQRKKELITIRLKYRNEIKEIIDYSCSCNLITGKLSRLESTYSLNKDQLEYLGITPSPTMDADILTAEGLLQRSFLEAVDITYMRINFEKAIPFPKGKLDKVLENDQMMAEFSKPFDLYDDSLH